MIGPLGILLRAKDLGLVSAIAPFVNDLRQASIRLSDAAVAEAMKLAGEY